MAPWVDKPIEEYDDTPWGKTIVTAVQKPSPGNDGYAEMMQVQYDPSTGERTDDIAIFWNLKELKRDKKTYETELALVQSKIAYVQDAIQNMPPPEPPPTTP